MRSALTKKLILLLVVCITAIGAAAQTRTLSGEVVEKSGDPLVGCQCIQSRIQDRDND